MAKNPEKVRQTKGAVPSNEQRILNAQLRRNAMLLRQKPVSRAEEGKNPETYSKGEVLPDGKVRRKREGVANTKPERAALLRGAPQETKGMKDKISADHKEWKRSTEKTYRDALKAAEKSNEGSIPGEPTKDSVKEAYNASLKSADTYNKGVHGSEAVQNASVASEYQKSLDAAKEYNERVQDSVQNVSTGGSYAERSAAAAKEFNDRVGAAVARPGASIEARSPTASEQLPPVGGWGARTPGQREAGRQRPPMEPPAPTEPVSEPELRSVFGTRAPVVEGLSRAGRLGQGENVGRQRELGPEAGSHLRNACANAQEAPENGERRSWWGFLRQRVNGFLTLGFLEFHHAETFRSGTKRTAGEVTAQASMLDQTRDLDIGQAQDEANRIRQMVGGSLTGGSQSLTTANILNIQAASNQIDAEKTASNSRIINRIVAQARGNVQERLAKYKNAFGKVVVNDDRQLAQFEERLRGELNSSTIGRGIRDPSILKRDIDFKQAVRERLDPYYWQRYVYGALDMVGGYFALSALAAKAVSWLTPGTLPPVPGAESIAPLPGSEWTTFPMGNNPWDGSRDFLQKLGVPNPTNTQIQTIDNMFCDANNIEVDQWNKSGLIDDHLIPKGFMMKVTPAILAVARQWIPLP